MIGWSLASRTVLSSVSRATLTFSPTSASISSNKSWSSSIDWNSNLGFPISALISSMKATIFLISSCPLRIASSITSSGTSSAPASIITIFSIEPATVRLRWLFALCSSVGLSTISSSTRPTLIPAIGPFQGISEIEIAIDVAIIPVISGEQSGSTARTVITTDTSFLISLGNKGLIGRSTIRDVRMAFSVGLPSLFINEPGILPTA